MTEKTTILLSEIEKFERRRIINRASTIRPPLPRVLFIHGAISGPSLTSVFLFVPFIGPCLALATIGLVIRLFWITRSFRSFLWWTLGVLLTLSLTGVLISRALTGIEFWLYIIFGFSMAGAIGSLVFAGALLHDQFDRARAACEVDSVDTLL